MNARLNVAVVGCGFMGSMHARVLAQLAGARLVAVVDRDPEAAARLAAETGAEAATDLARAAAPDVDAVVIATPDHLHVEPAVALLSAGKVVLLEKPMADTHAGAARIAFAAAGGRLMVGQILRFDPRYRSAADLMEAGEIGEPLHFAASRFCLHPGRRAVGSHLCFLMGVHDIDALHWLTGRSVRTAYARARADALPQHRVGVDDVVLATLELEGGALAQLAFGWTLPEGLPTGVQAGFRLVGTKGMAEVRETDENVLAVTGGRAHFPDTLYWPRLGQRIGGSLRTELGHFLEATLTGRDYLVPTDQALAACAVNDAILASLASGRPEAVAATPQDPAAPAMSSS
jgi:predicted dehydrogenase